MARRVRTIERLFDRRKPATVDGARALEVWSKDPDGSETFKGGQVRDGSGEWSATITDLAEYQAALKKAGVSDE